MKVAFYKGNKYVSSNLIKWWMQGKYSHVELVDSEGYSYSSSIVDKGVRKKYIDYSDGQWDVLDLSACFSEETAINIAKALIGSRYDYLGVFGFVIRKVKNAEKKLFCSEFVMTCLGYEEGWRFDPNTAYFILKRAILCHNPTTA